MMLVLVDHDRGTLRDATREAAALAHKAAGRDEAVEAMVVGSDASNLGAELADHGVSRVHAAQVAGDAPADYAPGVWAAGLVQLVRDRAPNAILAPGTDRGSEVMARVAARLERPLAAQCTHLEPGDGGVWHVTRQRWGGSLLEDAELDGDPALVTTAPNEVEAEPASLDGEAAVEPFPLDLEPADRNVVLSERIESESEGVPLSEARVVVGGGRGVGGPEGFETLETLADRLGGAVGGSRVATNNGWRPHDDQIGQTGNRIAPDLYIACGISGAIQHMVGCSGAKRILAINTDRDAPIVERADYAVIGDLHEIVPAIIEELDKRHSNGG